MKSQGFTLTELIITVAIAAIVLTIGVPSFQQTVRNNQATSQMNDLIGSLNLARSEAVKRGRRVVVCKSHNSQSNNPSCGGNWHDGWIVFVDVNNNAAVNTGAGDEILRVHGPLGGGANTLTGNTLVQDFISYAPDGFPRLLNGNLFSSEGEFTFDLASGNGNNVVAVGPTGRTTVKKN
jgi:type IV fimbrial biogenesis protein FimT